MIAGPKDSPYEDGQYHGKLVFPPEYPYKPPAIMMLTPKCAARLPDDPRRRAVADTSASRPVSTVVDSTQTRASASQ